MPSAKEQIAKILQDQPDDSSYDEIFESWPSREWSNGGLRTPMPEKRSAMKRWGVASMQLSHVLVGLTLPDACENETKIISSIPPTPTRFDNPSPQDLGSTPHLQDTRNSTTSQGRRKASADEGWAAPGSP